MILENELNREFNFVHELMFFFFSQIRFLMGPGVFEGFITTITISVIPCLKKDFPTRIVQCRDEKYNQKCSNLNYNEFFPEKKAFEITLAEGQQQIAVRVLFYLLGIVKYV